MKGPGLFLKLSFVLVCFTAPLKLAMAGEAIVPEAAIAQVKPAVVMIETNLGWGTGFFVSSDGYLLTNNHVIEEAQRITVIYRNRDRLAASIVAADEEADLALLKVEAKETYPTVILGDSDEVKEGTAVAVTGYPLPDVLVRELGSSLQCCTSRGIVSAFRRSAVPGVGRSRPLLQYDAGTTRGNSGGPIYLLDTGEVIAVVCLAVEEGGFLNLGIPINEAKLLLQKAGIIPRPNFLGPASSEAQVAPGDVSLLNVIGPDKGLSSLLASSMPFQLAPQGLEQLYEQIMSNAGYLSCYGQMAPPVSEPVSVGKRLLFTGNDGRVRVFDPGRVPTANPQRALFNVDSGFMFFPAVGNERQVCFSAGTPTFSAREKVDPGLFLLSVLAAAGGYPGGSVTKTVPTIKARGSIFAINPSNGNLDWEYKCGFVGTPIVAGDRIYFGGMGTYGALDAATGKEIWAYRDKLGATHAKWHTVTIGGNALYMTICPIEVKFTEAWPGFTVLGDGDLELWAVSLNDGKPLWKSAVTDLRGQENPLAVGLAADEANSRIYLTRAAQAFAFSPGGKLLWTFGEPLKEEKKKREKEEKELTSILTRFSTAIAFNDRSLYLGGDDGKVYCLNSKTGKERWSFTALAAMGDPSLIGDTLFCGSEDGWMYAIDPESGTLKWKVNTEFQPIGRPLLHEGSLYFSSQGAGGFTGQLHSVYVPQRVEAR